ncbi:MAG: tRNA epoxyqueuosine(34) reductase QueG [Myxococcota bacterium]|nr:tRNA epoxyqueuosine(34) reductase QueG [Myxococcota bacterium]
MQAGVSFSDQVRALGRVLGFDAIGIARADVSLDRDVAHYEAFVNAGMHGEMGWLARNGSARERLDGESVLIGAKSVVCLARRYQRSQDEDSLGGEVTGTIARYARGRDYHRFLRRRIRRLATFLRSLGTAARPVRARPLCDEEPILERAWAARAGLGFVGKNGMLIVPGVGSMVLLGEVVTTLELEPGTPIAERCGTCRRCLDACPTQAFERPFVLDARRCVSYLTIEHRSAIPLDLRAGIGTHLFGCDECQTVCPHNAGFGARAPLDSADGDPFAPLERWARVSLEGLLSLDEDGWRAMSEGTPIRRAGRLGMARNAAIVLGNRGDEEALPALRSAALHHEDAVVREAAAWAVGQLRRTHGE